MRFDYTICFIKRGTKLLLLNRNKKPAMGMWNGVGGKIEPNETPLEGVIREAFEETGMQLSDVTFAGSIILNSNNGNLGMYAFVAELPDYLAIETPLSTREGILEWKEIDWVLAEDNIGVISNLKCFLPKILDGNHRLQHTFDYQNHTIVNYEVTELKDEELNRIYQLA